MKRTSVITGICCCAAMAAGLTGCPRENPIRISVTLPAHGATGVSVAAQIDITFNQAAAPDTLTLQVNPLFSYHLLWSNENRTVTLVPEALLGYATEYSITVLDVASVEDVWIEDYYLFSFTTEVPGEGEGEGEGGGEQDYRQAMREFVQAISAYAKAQHPGFLIIPQNGEALLTESGLSDGQPSATYIAAIDGQGREDAFYGYDADNQATPAAERDAILGFLDLAEREGVEVLVTDYCSTPAFVDNSYAWNAAHGFVSFAANHRDLDNVPAYPVSAYNVNPAHVAVLQSAQNFLYLIDPGAFASRNAYINAIEATNHDALILDLFYDETALTAAEIAGMKGKANGGSRPAIAYMSIGEAEDYRYYWQAGWQPGAPAWIEAENPDWEGNYKVRYWDPGWQAIIFGSAGAYLDRILAAGFDGVYLDIIDAYEYFEENK